MPKYEVKPPSSRVLVIDDDEDFGRSIEYMLKSTGITIVPVRDVSSLLALEPGSGDLLLVDLVMPASDGIQVLGELACAHISSKVVITSGRSVDVLEVAAKIGTTLGLEIAGVLKKPFRPSQLRTFFAAPNKTAQLAKPQQARIDPTELVQALNNREIGIVLQPIIDIASGTPIAFEALARWYNRKHGIVTPERFLPVAAGAGLMPSVTETVVRQAAEQSACLQANDQPSTICVNFDASDLQEDDLPERLVTIVNECGISPSSLVIELTESSAIRNEITMMENLGRLRIRGFGLAIDDFGTSYSSLDRVRILPFSILKIDRSFVCDLERNVRARAIVEACVSLARRCKLVTVAEGVETRGQLEVLTRMGCQRAQGYFFAKPMPVGELLDWLERRTGIRRSRRRALTVRAPY